MEKINQQIEIWLTQTGISQGIIHPVKGILFVFLIVIMGILANWIAKRIILAIVGRLVRKSTTRWDDELLQKKFFHRLSHLAPVMVIYWIAPSFMSDFPKMVNLAYLMTNLYIIFMILIVFYAFLDSVSGIYNHYDIAKSRPIKGYLQAAKIITAMIAAIFAFSVLFDKSPIYFFTGLGAVTAILLLIFKDSILGFVAGVQVTTNNLVQIGDWIEMPKYGADGDVIDISLHTVIIRNFDRTLTTIPTYALVSDSFKNWRGMVQTGGRRIMRDIYIDINTIKLCDDEMLDKFESASLIKDYVKNKRKEIADYNLKHDFDPSVPVNGRKMTNIGTFRAYISAYLQNHPKIHKELIHMVRQMPSGEKGVPLQVYAFTNDIAWVNYEGIQADIFDHILSVVPFFGLRIFQFPSQITMQGNSASKTIEG